jgi:hypothetical protein
VDGGNTTTRLPPKRRLLPPFSNHRFSNILLPSTREKRCRAFTNCLHARRNFFGPRLVSKQEHACQVLTSHTHLLFSSCFQKGVMLVKFENISLDAITKSHTGTGRDKTREGTLWEIYDNEKF